MQQDIALTAVTFALVFLYITVKNTPPFLGIVFLGFLFLAGSALSIGKLNSLANKSDNYRAKYWTGVTVSLVIITITFSINYFVGIVGTIFCLGSILSSTGNAAARNKPIRGTNVESAQEAIGTLQESRSDDDAGVFWGSTTIPSKLATTHFMIMGTTGSGKTISLRLFMQSILPRIFPGSNRRAMLFDPKRDMLSLLGGMNLKCPVIVLNPFDQRCSPWDMATDITTPAAAQSLAEILIPSQQKENNPFFRDAVSVLLEGVVTWFMYNAPRAWTLRDIVLAMRNRETIAAILQSDINTEHYLDVLGDEKTAANIRATLITKMRPFWVIAACWHQAEQANGNMVSLTDWVNSEAILVLGEDKTVKPAIDAINQLLFTRASQLLQNKPESSDPGTFIVIDELPTAGKLRELKMLTAEGRSKGVSIALGFQDIEDVRRIYGREEAHTIISNCNNKAVLRLRSPETAKWASELFGDYEYKEVSKGTSYNDSFFSGQGRTITETERIARRRAVLESEFMNIPTTTPENGLMGYYLTGDHVYPALMPWSMISSLLRPANKQVADFLPVPDEYQRLKPWDETDKKRLNLEWLEATSSRIAIPIDDALYD